MFKGRKFGAFCNKDCLGRYRSRVLVGDMGANFKGGTKRDRLYLRVQASWHPMADKTGYVSLHRLVAEARIGRYLSAHEVVHHLDENPQNNHWDNLRVMNQADHALEHIQDGTIGRNNISGRFERAS